MEKKDEKKPNQVVWNVRWCGLSNFHMSRKTLNSGTMQGMVRAVWTARPEAREAVMARSSKPLLRAAAGDVPQRRLRSAAQKLTTTESASFVCATTWAGKG